MIVNDLFDIDVDRHNNPSRPLITGEVKKWEAIIYTLFIGIIVEYLTYIYLPFKTQIYLQLGLLNVLLYTPVFKKITGVKNLSCAGIVAFSMYFTGLNNLCIQKVNNLCLLNNASRFIFLGSYMNELLLDIRDKEGDKIFGINTIPVVFGDRISWNIAFMLLTINTLWGMYDISRLYNIKKGIVFSLFFIPIYKNIFSIKDNSYSKQSINYFSKETTKYLFMILIYLCSLANII